MDISGLVTLASFPFPNAISRTSGLCKTLHKNLFSGRSCHTAASASPFLCLSSPDLLSLPLNCKVFSSWFTFLPSTLTLLFSRQIHHPVDTTLASFFFDHFDSRDQYPIHMELPVLWPPFFLPTLMCPYIYCHRTLWPTTTWGPDAAHC